LVFFIPVADESILFSILEFYPKVDIDVEVSSSEDDVPKKSAGDDAGNGGASSAESIAPNSIRSNVSRQTDPSIADWAASTDPPVGRRRCKHPPSVSKQKQALPSTDQVMTQIELPPYLRPLVLVLRPAMIFNLRRRCAGLHWRRSLCPGKNKLIYLLL
jgi:hypothetical protein